MVTSALPIASNETYLSNTSRWSPGTDDVRAVGAAKFSRPAGLYLPSDQDEELGVALDASAVPLWEVKYRSSGNVETIYWLGDSFMIYPLCGSPPATKMIGLGALRTQQMIERGISVTWVEDKQTGAKRSRAAIMCYLEPAVKQGCFSLIRISLKSYQSDTLLAALHAHSRAVRQASEMLKTSQPLSPVALALPIAAGEAKVAGQGDRSVSFTPLVCGHPREITKSYVDTHRAPAELVARAEQDWGAVQEWARAFSRAGRAEETVEDTVAVPSAADIAAIDDPAVLETVRATIKRAVDMGQIDVDEAVDLEQQLGDRAAELWEGVR
jgi:hypothetical protein